MKVLWLINGMTREIKKLMNITRNEDISWITSTLEEIKKKPDIQLYVLFPQRLSSDTCILVSDNVTYLGFYQSEKKPWKINEQVRDTFRRFIGEISPDIIHIWGTEYAQALDMSKAAEQFENVVVHIQGMVAVLSKFYMADLPYYVQHGFTFRDLLRGSNVRGEQRNYEKRGKNEVRLLQNINYVMGRTTWDKVHSLEINPDLKYFHCNESMRPEFFEHNWEWGKAERYSIFITQAYYPIKGFHYFLEALTKLVREFPRIRVRVAGTNPVYEGKNKIREGSYGRYIRKYIKKHHLKPYIEFIGYQDVQGMIKEYLRANVFVISSAVENSPNSLAEAMALGVPCVAADVGGISSMLQHKKSGFLYTHNDASMLAYYISELFRKVEISQRVSAEARIYARERYSAERNVERLLEIYRGIIERKWE